MSKRRIFLDVTGNAWVQPVRKDYGMACCDCGLVHRIDFRVKAGRAQFRVRRDSKSTRYVRGRDKHAFVPARRDS